MPIIDPGTVIAIWLFDEDGNEFAIDSSENGHDGQIMGNVEWVDGKFGSALEFPGVGGVIGG